MKVYLIVTGTLFGLFAVTHVWATIVVLDRLGSEPGMVLGRGGIALVTGALGAWAWRLGVVRARSV